MLLGSWALTAPAMDIATDLFLKRAHAGSALHKASSKRKRIANTIFEEHCYSNKLPAYKYWRYRWAILVPHFELKLSLLCWSHLHTR